MKNTAFFAFLLFNISCQSQSLVFQQEWVGQVTLFGHSQYAQISAKGDTVTLQLPDEGPDGEYLLSEMKVDNGVQFSMTHKKGEWHFVGQLVGEDKIEGTLKSKDLIGKFLFFKALETEKSEWQPCLGNYQLPSGNFLRVSQGLRSPLFHSGISEHFNALKRVGDERYLSPSLELLQFSDLQNDQFNTVEWQSFDGQRITAKRVAPYRVEDHLIITSTDTIGASLYMPGSAGKHPACIIPIGAAPYNRLVSDMEAEIFATHGIATLIYDNYGFGKSSGNLREKTFVDKQQVTIELFRWLQQHPEIDANKIGLRGASQGGRIALMAASAIPETAFLVLVATPMETRMDQQIYAISALHRQQNFSEEAIARSGELWRKFFTYAVTNIIDTSFVEELRSVRELYPSMELPNASLESPPNIPLKDDILNSTSSYLPTVNCPVLCLFGSLDDRVPPQKSIHQLRSGLEAAGHQPPTVIVYDGIAHSFMRPGFRIVEGLFMNQVRFMREEVGLD